MLNFHVITLFPELIETYCSVSVIGRGIKSGYILVATYNLRNYCQDKYRKVDDTPYGGGAGMVLKPEPFFAACQAIEKAPQSPILLMTPQGLPLEQAFANSLAQEQHITLLCGHYEGFDERIRALATHEVSIGDYVLSGGELAALVVIDAVARLVPGVLGKADSLTHESFVGHILEGPHYTKPALYKDMAVPEILRCGDHAAIARWRKQQALKRTFQRRPDLLQKAQLTDQDRQFLASLKKEEDG